MLKKYSLLISIIYSIVLAALSLFKINTVTQELPSNSDKLFHALAYLIFTLLWFLAFFFNKKLSKVKALSYAFLCSVCFGIAIEVLQGLITVNRQCDVNDVIANVIGTIIAAIIILSLKKEVLKNNNTLLF
ncbi:VanZ family protein [uncultured Lacinutrix sp.]|uniref:VanZ family protein n=1 Tax=uncultured Lacinutrix sp. TaxID=574032 RepID=UPI0026270A9B|nr:VanZ family protein [uncultured Lacinutrix sp.]